MLGGWSIDYWGGGPKNFCHITRGVEIFFPVGLGGGGGRKKMCTSHENVTGPPTPAGNK